MYTLPEYAEFINSHRDLILGNLRNDSIDTYVFLSNRFHECDVSQDQTFQLRFRSFYGLNSAGLTEVFKTEYFNSLQALRGTNPIDLRSLAFQFYVIPTLQGHNTLQFSFVTKLAHTLNADYPIYDDRVATAFAFSRPMYRSFNHRLDRLMDFYDRLREAYDRFITEGLLNPAITGFRTRFRGQAPSLCEIKIIDFIFWSTGTLIRAGRLPDVPNDVLYA